MHKKIVRKKLLTYRKKKFKYIDIKYSSFINILKKFNFLKKKNIGVYYPINCEIECFKLIKTLEKKGYKISLPIIKNNKEMDFFEWSFEEPLNINFLGICIFSSE